MWAGIACAATGVTATRAAAEALLVIEAESGKVLFAHNAGHPWYPASVTKLMTAYVTLRAVKEGPAHPRHAAHGLAQRRGAGAVEDGFQAGTVVTVDNALKMLMVKSANDMAVVLAEGVAGSIENFADEMNGNARRLGMIQSSFVNPNGLPADDQISSARDMAILARALIRELPEYDYYWHLPGIRMGKMVQRNYNTLIGRYPGADGMKTGFICASGFNLVASATRNGRRLIAVVLGAPLVRGARHEGRAAARTRLQQQQRAVVADAVARHGRIGCSRSTPRRPTCATKCAGVTASARPPRIEDDVARQFPPGARPTRSSCRACARRRPRAPRSCKRSRWASRCSSIPAPSRRRPDRRRRPSRSRAKKKTAAIKPAGSQGQGCCRRRAAATLPMRAARSQSPSQRRPSRWSEGWRQSRRKDGARQPPHRPAMRRAKAEAQEACAKDAAKDGAAPTPPPPSGDGAAAQPKPRSPKPAPTVKTPGRQFARAMTAAGARTQLARPP